MSGRRPVILQYMNEHKLRVGFTETVERPSVIASPAGEMAGLTGFII